MRLRQTGLTQEEVARKLSLSTRTIRRWEQAGQFPERAPVPPRRKQIDRWVPYLERRWSEGRSNALALWQELRQLGYRGSRGAVQRWATGQRQIAPPQRVSCRPRLVSPSPRQATWWLLQEPAAREENQSVFVRALEQLSPAIAQAAQQAREFVSFFRDRRPHLFPNGSNVIKPVNCAALLKACARMKELYAAPSLCPGVMDGSKVTCIG